MNDVVTQIGVEGKCFAWVKTYHGDTEKSTEKTFETRRNGGSGGYPAILLPRIDADERG
jgi:hypothetical protein